MLRNLLTGLALGAVLATSFLAPAQAADPQKTWDGLQRIKSDKMDEAYLRPGVDFRVYDKVILDPVQVSFGKTWLRDMKSPTRGPGGRVAPEDIERIRKDMADGFRESLLRHLNKAGYKVVDHPGPDVLRLTPVLMDVYVNAPDTSSVGRVDMYTFEAGEATLAIEARDSASGQLLGRAVDHRRTGWSDTLRWTTRVTNRAEFDRLFDSWSRIIVEGLASLKESAPIGTAGK